MKKIVHGKMTLMALVIALVMLMSVCLAACEKDGKDNIDWTSGDKTHVLALNVERQESGGAKKLVITYKDDVFAEHVNKEYFKISAYVKAETTGQASNVSDKNITNVTIVRDSAKQLTISLAEEDGDYWGYNVIVHAKATTVNKYGEGYCFATIDEVITPDATIKVNGKISAAKADPIITLTLENTISSAVIIADMVKLSGALSTLEVTQVIGNWNTIVIATSGNVARSDTPTGTIELSQYATISGKTLNASVEINNVSAWVEESTYKLAANDLSFDIVLGGDTFKDGITSFAAGATQFDVVSISADKSKATVKTKVAATALDDAILEIKGKILAIEPVQVTSGAKKEVAITATVADIIMMVRYAKKIDATTYEATAEVIVQNGKFEELSKTDFAFEGDFQGATVEKLRQHGNVYSVMFRFSKSGVNIEECSLTGKLKLSSGKIMNNWNTASQKLSCAVTYFA